MSLHQRQKHPEYVEGCFGCKASTIDLNAGEASTRLTMSAKKWDNELANKKKKMSKKMSYKMGEKMESKSEKMMEMKKGMKKMGKKK